MRVTQPLLCIQTYLDYINSRHTHTQFLEASNEVLLEQMQKSLTKLKEKYEG